MSNIHLDDLLEMLNMEVLNDREGIDILIPLEVAEEIKKESPQKQSLIVQGLLRLKYDKNVSKSVTKCIHQGKEVYQLTIPSTGVKN